MLHFNQNKMTILESHGIHNQISSAALAELAGTVRKKETLTSPKLYGDTVRHWNMWLSFISFLQPWHTLFMLKNIISLVLYFYST